ncbi:hypothetical protein TUM4644_37130 [Shewanella colwelliana]|uniref:hypothetical protein n=1 Tax=Shewanella colwelliana TaxID=23 RepID=UPI0004B87345|nr:hypothetical protein [Shewanella colwelliana]GIU36048.1 hypothetical protein TUM4644_37130 [Shewanella colwelliana]
MTNELVTGLYFNELHHRMWIMYTELYPEPIDGIDKERYVGLLEQLRKTNGTRYDIYNLLLFKGETESRIFDVFEASATE